MLDTISPHQQSYTSLSLLRTYSLNVTIDREENGTDGSLSVIDRISIRQKSGIALTSSSALQVEAEAREGYRKLRDLVANLLKEQGIATTIDTDDGETDLTALTPAGAQGLVAEDGFFGVEKTADRIVTFAKAVAGNDPSRIDAIREGIKRGFEEAKKTLEGWLPDISHDTYKAVMDKLDHWVSEAETVSQAGIKQR